MTLVFTNKADSNILIYIKKGLQNGASARKLSYKELIQIICWKLSYSELPVFGYEFFLRQLMTRWEPLLQYSMGSKLNIKSMIG